MTKLRGIIVALLVATSLGGLPACGQSDAEQAAEKAKSKAQKAAKKAKRSGSQNRPPM